MLDQLEAVDSGQPQPFVQEWIDLVHELKAAAGITPLQRYLLCHLVSSAVEKEFGIPRWKGPGVHP